MKPVARLFLELCQLSCMKSLPTAAAFILKNFGFYIIGLVFGRNTCPDGWSERDLNINCWGHTCTMPHIDRLQTA